MRHRMFYWVTAALLIAGFVSTPSVPARAQSSRVVFQDDFVDNEANWKPVFTDTSTMDIANGVMTFSMNASGQANWAVPAATVPDDVDLDLEADPIDPNPNGNWNLGVLLRADRRDTSGSFYHFGLNGLGNWEFRVRPKNAQSYTNAISTGQIPNFNAARGFKLHITARGNQFTFTINNSKVGTFEDSTLATTTPIERYFGVMVGTYENADKNKVEFRKLVITEPVTPNVARGKVLLSENFNNNDNGWTTTKQTNSDASLKNNALVVQVNRTGFMRWVFPKATYPADIDISVNASNPNPDTTGGWSYGIGFRPYYPSGDGNDLYFYLFEVIGTGNYSLSIIHISTSLNVDKVLIEPTPIKDFVAGNTYNMRVITKGSSISLYLDNQLLNTITDSSIKTLEKHSVMLTASTTAGADSMQVRFDNFIVAEPAE